MPNLVPQIRTDRNGKPVTRWVSPDETKIGDGKGIPAPKVAAPKPDYREYVLKRIAEEGIFKGTATALVPRMSDHELETVHKAMERCGADYVAEFSGRAFAGSSMHDLITIAIVYDSKLFTEEQEDPYEEEPISRHERILHAARIACLRLGYSAPHAVEPEGHDAMRRMVRYIDISDGRTDSEVIELLKGETAYDPDLYMEVLEENQHLNDSQIKSILDSGTTAFSSGTL